MTLFLCFLLVFGIGMVVGDNARYGNDVGAGIVFVAGLVGLGRILTLFFN